MKEAFRITVNTPVPNVEDVINGICSVWPIRIGNYENVFWCSSPGTEQFKPLPGADPTQGTIGVREKVDSVAVCFLIPADESLLERIVEEGIKPVHPWEVPVIMADRCLANLNELEG